MLRLRMCPRVAPLAALVAPFLSLSPAQGQVYSATSPFFSASTVDRFTITTPPTPPTQTNLVPATQGITQASGLTLGPGNFLYLTSRSSNDVFRIDPATGATTTYANLAAQTQGPAGLAFRGNDLYVSQFVSVQAANGSGAVDRYDVSSGTPVFVSQVVSNLTQPAGLSFGPDGILYVSTVGYNTAQQSNGTGSVIRYDPGTGQSRTLVANQLADPSSNLVSASAAKIGPDGSLFVVDTIGNAVRRYDPTTGAFLGNFTVSNLLNPSDLIFDGGGRAWVANLGNEFNQPTPNPGTINRYNEITGAYIDTVASSGFYASLAVQPVPEPAAVLGAAAAGLAGWGWRRRRAARPATA